MFTCPRTPHQPCCRDGCAGEHGGENDADGFHAGLLPSGEKGVEDLVNSFFIILVVVGVGLARDVVLREGHEIPEGDRLAGGRS